MMPFSAAGKPLSPVDALFTVTSGVCVTGLTVISVEKDLSFWGQLILLVCIQLGGIGIMTFSTFFLFILRRAKLSFMGRETLYQTLTPGGTLHIYQLLFSVFKLTFIIETIGAIALLLCWYPARYKAPFSQTLWDAVFHSVSAFCNAGFSTFTENLYRYRTNIPGVLIIAILIILGGLGFVVLEEIFFRRLKYSKEKRIRPLSLQTRLVLLVSLILIVVGALMFYILDVGNSLAGESFPAQVVDSLFQSITARTAGFNTVDIGQVSNLGLLLLMFLMFIGGSPGSAAGGIKTTTAAIIFATIVSHIKNRRDVEMFRRRVPEGTVSRAFVILVMGLVVVTFFFGLITLVDKPLLATHSPQDPAIRLLFETVSAFGTVGLSTGITPLFNTPGKLLLIVLMLIGRLGPLTIAVALLEQRERVSYRYPKEDIMVG